MLNGSNKDNVAVFKCCCKVQGQMMENVRKRFKFGIVQPPWVIH